MKKGEITESVIGAALEIHQQIGPGLLESAYEECLCHELTLRRIGFQRQLSLPVQYKGVKLECGYRLDLLVEDTVVVEIKAVDSLLPVHEAQLLSYRQLGGWPVGLLLNFHAARLKDGLRRKVL
jgi:GxxExxY protein